MKNEMQLKALIKKIAQGKNIQAQAVMQNYMFERLLERISLSDFSDKFILKGGMLIAAMVGLEHRSTMDMDATIRNYPVNEEAIRNAFDSIAKMDIGDGVTFEITGIESIREDVEYGGLRVALEARFLNVKVWLKIDITTNDVITPHAVRYTLNTMFDDRPLTFWAYNLETVIAEKYETVIRRGVANTRPRDFYDIHMLLKTQGQRVSLPTLLQAIQATTKQRGSDALIANRDAVLKELYDSPVMLQRWMNYIHEFSYTEDIRYEDILGGVKYINDAIAEQQLKNRSHSRDLSR